MAATCCTCKTPAATRTGGCTTSTCRPWQRRDLTPFEGVQTELIATERDFPDEILIGLNKDNPQLHDVYRLDLKTGELGKELVNPGLIGMLADAQLVVRAGLRPQPDGSMSLVVRDSADRRVAGAAGDPGRGLADHGPGRVQYRRRLACCWCPRWARRRPG